MYEYINNFKKAGFGMFVHFGLYSVLGKGEWALNIDKLDAKKYNALVDRFKVRKDWAKKLVDTAKKAGCKYITLTTRHHDGFSLFDVKGLNDFDAPHSASGRDLVREFVDECRAQGITPFFYHTLLDWHNEDYKNDFPKYIDYLDKSIEILCTNYGKIGGFWFDGMWDKPNEDWQEDRLYGTIRKYQPEAMIINNTGLNALGQTGHKEIDSVTFERGKPTFVDTSLKPIAGEMCESMTDHWGYTKDDICIKPIRELVETLIDCRKFGCNLLLNVGVKGNGRITPIENAELLAIGKWIKANKNFIYDSVPANIESNGADLLTDGEYYYALVKNVPMRADENVALAETERTVELKTDKKIISALWLDNGKKVKVHNNVFVVDPFTYGHSLGARVAKFKLK